MTANIIIEDPTVNGDFYRYYRKFSFYPDIYDIQVAVTIEFKSVQKEDFSRNSQSLNTHRVGGLMLFKSVCRGFKSIIMSRRKQQSAFDQVSEFDRGRIVAYRDCGLSFRKIGSRVGRNKTTVMRICDRWKQEGTTDRRG
ncbi:transposable element Tcb1 transposase [Trichonephila clavipes]|nr:transposable element Tcb1 transposase [Trichonephila clavipes]